MVDSCCPGKDPAPPVPTVAACPGGGRVPNAICLPSSCQSRMWQLVTCQESHRPSGGTLTCCDPVSHQPAHLPDMSCVGFICQPIGSDTACCRPGTSHSPRAVSSSPSPCSDSTDGEAQCCDASSCQQSSCQEPACTPGPCQVACGRPACLEAKPRQPPHTDTVSSPETSCPPVLSAAGPCQVTCCQGASWHPPCGEDQPCGAACYQPIGYVFEPCQSVPCVPGSCQPLLCAFSSCSSTCWVPSHCQACHCQPLFPISFICPPVATCQSTCPPKSPCKPVSRGTVHSGQPTCGGCTSHRCGRKSPSCEPTCCVTGSGNASGCSSCLLTSCQPRCESACHTPTLALA